MPNQEVAVTQTFPTYQAADRDLEGWFEPEASLPPVDQIVGVVVLPFLGALQLVLVKVRKRRAWEFPGGHVERAEKPPDAARREAREEAGVELGELHLVGRKWLRLLNPDRPELRPYDDHCLLVYWAQVAALRHLPPDGEISERRVVPIREAGEVLGGYWPPEHLVEILDYTLAKRERESCPCKGTIRDPIALA